MNVPTVAFACLLSIGLSGGSAWSQTLRIALSAEPTAVDPHYHNVTPNNALATHLFSSLVEQDEKQRLQPALAKTWENDGRNRWTFKLRQGVSFSNGAPFTADDVIFTFCRLQRNETKVTASFGRVTANFASVTAVDDHTLAIETLQPEPLLPNYLSDIAILSASIVPHGKITYDLGRECGVTGPWPVVGNFNDGTAAVGTGPYKLKSYVHGSAIDLERNPTYWGEAEPWAAVQLLPVTSTGPRFAGLLAGDYDVIENPAARDLGRIRNDKRFSYIVTPSARAIILQLDVGREKSPAVKAADGRNPLQDVRVRKALSLAIDRDTIIKRLMDGSAEAAYQFMPVGMFGTLPNPAKLTYDPAASRKLLAEAGYPNGFQITVATTNNRYVNDSQIVQAVAQYWAQIGVKTEVDAMPSTIYFPRRAKREFSVALAGFGSTSGETSQFLRVWAATPDEALAIGSANYGGYSSEVFDRLIREAIVTFDDDKRSQLLQKATVTLLDDMAFVPLHFESSIWAFKADLAVTGRTDQFTQAMSVKPKK
ncbi:ABC transporter substrate-binding protein [Azospirillum griseum]|uniref:ABC transporter substrate-binding protein n=1 Tax=Azospirillum griseum TaxID=2496639 RepID=A0A3S0K032_9PROT|nr:ABC transporter substrate-binding protein [Azospirillum griseum]RTR12774.1 ABC transporter substrate-binding protein [Azospirillum griseum]